MDVSSIKAISFDGDQTLWDFEKAMRHALTCALTEIRRHVTGPHVDALTVEDMIRIRDATAADLKASGARLVDLRAEAFRRTLASVGVDDEALAARINSLYRTCRFASVELFPDVMPVFEALSPTFALGLLSNGNTLPALCNIDGWLQFVVFAEDHGVAKPDRGLFEIALSQADCRPGQLLHVGDELGSDVLGAQNAGVASVWLNRDGTTNDTGIEPDVEIRSLAELVPMLTGGTE